MEASIGLSSEITRLRRRVRLLLCERWGLFGAAAGAVVSAAVVLLSSKYDELLSYGLWAAIVALGAFIGVAVALLKRLTDLTVAAAADRRTGLKERLSTAVAFSSSEGEMEQAVRSDASSRIGDMRSADVFRHRFGMPHWVFLGALALLLGIVFIPQMAYFQSQTRRQEIAVMKREGENLVKLAKDMKKIDTSHEELRKLADKLEKLGQKMETGRMSRKQAMLKTQRLEKEIKSAQDKLAKENSSTKTMEQARADMRRSSDELAKSIAQQIAKKENIPPEEALKKVPTDKQLADLARKDGPLTEAEKQQLEQALSKYADPNNNAPIPAELGEALAKLAANHDYQKAAQLMKMLAKKLNTGNMSQQDQKMLASQMAALAKALKNTDMDKLAKQMFDQAKELAKMSPQELQKMIDEMQKMQQMAKALQKAGGG